ncbi:TetR/AcrR family transcriptional regulator [Sanguibacter suaedae]|uniref:TetR/AcrR family transcriptional regulator n=1 Tax=Sanguibacter suaedae TaxID=2795737 RepID=A0A934I645_9MICO|nr:TetR/AcrR family transcriptional regulator [Sanguibacter suaedae]MBI9113897.1 TetR/AcrR family transcriptional regulator [Sanguibacter suaedae]
MDPRIARTRALLQEALLSLARERDLDAISVADIADRATVNRSTFYQHYSDKETLLADALDAQVERAGANLSEIVPITSAEDPPDILVRYIEHLAENAALYRKALGEHGSPITMTRLRRRFTAIVTEGIEAHGFDHDASDLPLEVAAASITGSLMGVLTTWLELEPMPDPARAADWAWRMLVPAQSHLEGSDGPHDASCTVGR